MTGARGRPRKKEEFRMLNAECGKTEIVVQGLGAGMVKESTI
jgi:hypothetical protein